MNFHLKKIESDLNIFIFSLTMRNFITVDKKYLKKKRTLSFVSIYFGLL